MSDNPDILFDIGRSLKGSDKDTRSEVIRLTLPAFFDRGIGITEAAKTYRAAGIKFSDSTFREIFNEQLFEYQSTTKIQQMDRGDYVNEFDLSASKYSLTDNYRFVAQVTIINRETGTPEYRHFSMDTDELGTVEEIENRLLDFYTEHYGSLPEKAISIRVIQGQIDKGL